MQALLRTSLLVLVVIAITSCYTPAQFSRNQAATESWLQANAGKSHLDLDGSWYAETWGHAHLDQTGNKVTGHIGRYPVHGVVNGNTVYLAVDDEGWTILTIVASYARRGVMEGFYSERIPYSDQDREPIVLVRTHR